MADPTEDPNFGDDKVFAIRVKYEASLTRIRDLLTQSEADTRRLKWWSWPVVRAALVGLVLIAVVAWLGQGFIAHQYYAFRLSKNRAAATGTITAVQTEVAKNDDGSGGPYLLVTYVFVIPSGERITGTDKLDYSSIAEAGDLLHIQYLRADPTVNGVEDSEPRGQATALIVNYYRELLCHLCNRVFG
jgi:hypothetical protein